jgi:hypothetical protein
MTLRVPDLKHLEKIVKAIRAVHGVLGVTRQASASRAASPLN